jgi:hypothetical protein
MGIFNSRNKQEETEPEGPQVDLYTPQMITKRLLWDIVPCSEVEKMLPLMNLTPDSPDVSEMEHKASHKRLAQVGPLGEMLALLVPIVSGITASAMLNNSGFPADEEAAITLTRHHSVVLTSGVVAVLANLLDMGIIEYTDGVTFGEQLLG